MRESCVTEPARALDPPAETAGAVSTRGGLLYEWGPQAWIDSPRQKWRKRYGNLVREMEWVFVALEDARTPPSEASGSDLFVGGPR